MNHTPLPWIREGDFIYRLSQHNVNTFSCQLIGGYTDDGTRTSKEELAATAAFIVQACIFAPGWRKQNIERAKRKWKEDPHDHARGTGARTSADTQA
jgi:hypothetical protein